MDGSKSNRTAARRTSTKSNRRDKVQAGSRRFDFVEVLRAAVQVFLQRHPPEKKKPKLSHIKREKKNRSNQNKKLFYNFKEKKRKSQKKFF
jgi:hypothetical protein